MSWVTITSIIVLILFVLNSIFVVFWLRPKLTEKTGNKRVKTWRRKAGHLEIFISILVVLCGLALVGVPVVAPTSRLANWIAEYGMFNYVVWCFLGVFVLSVIFSLISFMLKKDDAA